jgi:hypothetical protein
MRTSFHHQPEAQHPNFPLSASWQADYPIYRLRLTHVPVREPRSAAGLTLSLAVASSIASGLPLETGIKRLP